MARRGPRTSIRAGFTLLELLVVMVLVAVVIGMLFPAIQKVRESASRVQCGNNLKQIGIALRSYHDAHLCLPQGGSHLSFWDNPPSAIFGDPETKNAPTNRKDLWSWAYQILPQMGHNAIYKSAVGVVDATPIKNFYCPSRREPTVYSDGARIDYAASAGDRSDGANGCFGRTYLVSIVRMPSDIPDGLPNTILVAEKQMNLSLFGTGAGDNEPYTRAGWNDDYEVYRRGNEPPAKDYRSPTSNSSQVFGSSHLVGVNAVFCDGSVRSIRYSVDPTTFRRACVRNDEQPYNLNEL